MILAWNFEEFTSPTCPTKILSPLDHNLPLIGPTITHISNKSDSMGPILVTTPLRYTKRPKIEETPGVGPPCSTSRQSGTVTHPRTIICPLHQLEVVGGVRPLQLSHASIPPSMSSVYIHGSKPSTNSNFGGVRVDRIWPEPKIRE